MLSHSIFRAGMLIIAIGVVQVNISAGTLFLRTAVSRAKGIPARMSAFIHSKIIAPSIVSDDNRRQIKELTVAIRNQDVVSVRNLLNKVSSDNLDLNVTEDRHMLTPLMSAAEKGCPKVIEELLKRGANPNVGFMSSRSPRRMLFPLERAVVNGSVEAAGILLEKGAKIAPYGRDLLCDAIESGNSDMVTSLLSYNALSDIPHNNHHPLVVAVRNVNKVDSSVMIKIITQLCDHGANPSLIVPDCDTGEPVSLVQMAQSSEIRNCLHQLRARQKS